jgi:hypothetical protein
MPRGVQDRVRERQEGFFAADERRRVCNDWPVVAALLLVLSLVATKVRNSAATGLPRGSGSTGQAAAGANFAAQLAEGFGTGI